MTREQAETVRRNILANNPSALIDLVEENGDWTVVPRTAAPSLGAGEAGAAPAAIAVSAGAAAGVTTAHRAAASSDGSPTRATVPVVNETGRVDGDAAVARGLQRAATEVGVDARLLGAIAWLESSFRPTLASDRSSAKGLFQFIDTTWTSTVADFGGRHGVTSAMRLETEPQCLMGACLLDQNTKTLARRLGRQPDAVECYLAHLLGSGGGPAVAAAPMTSGVDEPLRPFYPGDKLQAALKANREILLQSDGRPNSVARVREIVGQRLAKGFVQADRLLGGLAAGQTSPPAAAHAEAATISEGEPALPADARAVAAAELAFPGPLPAGAAGRRLAARIQEWCCLNDCSTPIDGNFSDGTRRALERFQQARGLPATGEVDGGTWTALTAPMRQAVGPVPDLAGRTLNDAVVAVARHHLAQKATEPPGGKQNTGPWVRLYMDGVDGEERLWCAGFVSFVVAQAANALGRPMPLKRRVSCDRLVEDARQDGRFISEATLDQPSRRTALLRPGMIFVRRVSAADWNHTGLVTAVAEQSFDSIEGNTNPSGSNNGGEVRELSHGYAGYDFIALEPLR